MRLRNIAFENIKRRKSKMLFMILGMVVGIATVVSIFQITRTMQHDVEMKIDEYGANIMIVPRSNTLSMTYGGMSIPGANYDLREIKETEMNKIWTIKNKNNLLTVSSKLLGAGQVNNELILLVGADLSTEIKLKKWWKFTDDSTVELTRAERPSPIDPERNVTDTVIKDLTPREVILGYRVAEKLGLSGGDKFTISRDNRSVNVSVKGIVRETGSQDDSIIFMDLNEAQNLLSKDGKITMVEVAALCAGCPVEELADQINAVIPGGMATPIKQVVEQRMETIGKLTNFGLVIGIVILLIGSLIVFTTMTGSVNERIREIGVFRAIGFRKSHIIRIILIEAFILSFISGILGYILGWGATQIASPMLTGETTLVGVNFQLALAALVMAVVIGMGATLSPAIRASNADPSEALRHL